MIAATQQQLRANDLMVLLIQGRDGCVTIGDSGGTRRRWRQWNASLGDLCRLHIRNHIRKEIAKLIFDLPAPHAATNSSKHHPAVAVLVRHPTSHTDRPAIIAAVPAKIAAILS